jgi:hypothetical protein
LQVTAVIESLPLRQIFSKFHPAQRVARHRAGHYMTPFVPEMGCRSLTIEAEDFELEPLLQRGGLGKAYQVFGKDLEPILKELNEVLVQ